MSSDSSPGQPVAFDPVEYGDALVTALLASDELSAHIAMRGLEMDDTTRDVLVYLAGSVAHMWEQSCEDPLAEWAEALTIRAAQRTV